MYMFKYIFNNFTYNIIYHVLGESYSMRYVVCHCDMMFFPCTGNKRTCTIHFMSKVR